MAMRQGFSQNVDTQAAVQELHDKIWFENLGAVIFFASPVFDRAVLAETFNGLFANAVVIGCTTAGEIAPDGYQEGTLVGLSLSAEEFKTTPVLVENLSTFRMEDGEQAVRSAFGGSGLMPPSIGSSPQHSFGMLLIDGMSKQEELVVSSLSRFLDPVPLFGGSAGDNLNFKASWVFLNGAFHSDAAILTIITTPRPFKVFKLDHFRPTSRKMVVTAADPSSRLVSEINAEPAARAYAELVGLEAQELSPMIFAAFPVVVKIGGEYHVRSIQKVEPDGSLRFYCGIDEGLVLTVASGEDMSENLDRNLAKFSAEVGGAEMILGFDCILRRLEAEQKQQLRQVSEVLQRHKVIGFSTYGEQFSSMHVNQTFTGVAIGKMSEANADLLVSRAPAEGQ